jgi:tetratricopeptide (TPR) repeat protein
LSNNDEFDDWDYSPALFDAIDVELSRGAQRRQALETARAIVASTFGEPMAMARMRSAVRRNPDVAHFICDLVVSGSPDANPTEWATAASWALPDEDPLRNPCLARALAAKAVYMLRRESDLPGAWRVLLLGAGYAERCGDDREVSGIVSEARANLLHAEHRLSEAFGAIAMACALYSESQNRPLLGRAYMMKAAILNEQGESNDAIDALIRSLQHSKRTPRYLMIAGYNLAIAEGHAGRFDMVDKILADSEAVWGDASHEERARMAWGVAGLCALREKPQQAEHYYRQARRGFQANAVRWSFAHCTLEFCDRVLLPAGRTAELRSLVDESLPVLAEFGLEAGQLEAWRLLRQATLLDGLRVAAAIKYAKSLLRAA